MITLAIIPTAATVMDQHLEEGMIFTLPATPHPVPTLTQTLDILTTRQLDTAMEVPLPRPSLREITISNLMKLKYFMKQLKTEVTPQLISLWENVNAG